MIIMRLPKVILFLLFVNQLQAQVKTITLRKAEPYDTQHVTLSFKNEAPVMPKFTGGKNNFDASIAIAYSNLVYLRANPNQKKRNNNRFYIRTNNNQKQTKGNNKLNNLPLIKEQVCDSCFYEGNTLDKAGFVNVETYCDTDGTIIILPQNANDIYTLVAIQIVRQLPKFIPAQYNEEAVPVYLTIPIRFLNEVKINSVKNINDTTVNSKHRCKLWRWIWGIRN